VGEDEVDAAAVDVEALAQQPDRHGRALDVPAGPARTPGRLPRRLAGLGRLPEGEVDRGTLALVDLDPGAGRLQQVVEPAVGEVAVAGWSAAEQPQVEGRQTERADVLFPKPASV